MISIILYVLKIGKKLNYFFNYIIREILDIFLIIFSPYIPHFASQMPIACMHASSLYFSLLFPSKICTTMALVCYGFSIHSKNIIYILYFQKLYFYFYFFYENSISFQIMIFIILLVA